MSQVLEAITWSLDELNDNCGCATFALRRSGGGSIEISVPRTRRGRELYRSLLLEVGRLERENLLSEAKKLAKRLSAELKSQEGPVQ